MTKYSLSAKRIALTGVCAALLTGGKLALMALPNIEIVTLLIMLYAYAFGFGIAVPATLVFCAVEGMLFGFNTWLISYFIYWPSLAIAVLLIKKTRIKNIYVYAACGVLMTALFGVITGTVDALVSSRVSKISFFVLFSAIYVRGILFYVVHVVSNAVVLFSAFPPLSELFLKAESGLLN